jgi:proline iminopeptidase
VLSAVLASAIVYFAVVRPRVRDWGFDPLEAELPMPGDDLISEPSATETRGITIDAPPAKVWPWLVQMGFERGGWYSYDALDTRHPPADRILPEFQSLKAGDTVPYGPGSGFRVEAVDPERELVLYVDADLARRQADQAIVEGILPADVSRASFPEFSASWVFYLKPIDDDKTRLIERFRARTPGAGPVKAVMGEIMGTGLVLMGRKQMIGIKERVERFDQEMTEAIAEPSPAFSA